MVTKNKRGQDLSIGTLILIVLGIIVLVLLILGFTMGWDNLWGKINIFGGTATRADVVIACKLAASSQDTYTFCEKNFTVKEEVDGKMKTRRDIQCKHVNLGDVTPLTCPPPASDATTTPKICTALGTQDKPATWKPSPCNADTETDMTSQASDKDDAVNFGKKCCLTK